ncbi:MAG: serine/threonine protein kinase [Actinobacteria bacterium]|nr:serine/threonine protein kinase [Actinomycetota bacterium]
MSTYTSDPGTRLGGRYRLQDRLATTAGWSAWKAVDEILARPVSVITFADGFPRFEYVVTAARAASRLTDTRLTQVFDVEDRWDHGYIVLEWPVGDTLGDLLAEGPIEPDSAARIIADAADALSGAHAAGLAHLCLRPDAIRWTAGGGVKVTGLGIDAALSGVGAEDPELADTQGLGELLYAALTGLWPGPDSPDLPPAPHPDGLLATPREIRAAVPPALDEITWRALGMPGTAGHAEYRSPAELAAALSAVTPPVQPPPAVLPRSRRRLQPAVASWGRDSRQRSYGDQLRPRYFQDWSTRQRSPLRAVAVGALVVAAVVGLSAVALQLLNRPPSPIVAAGNGASQSAPSATTVPAGSTITPVSASGFDALNPADTGNENNAEAMNVLTGQATGWSTQQYIGGTTGDNPTFGNLKAGTGLILDLGQPYKVTSVTVQFGSAQGANVQIKVGNSNARTAANLQAMATVASADNVSGAHTFMVQNPVAGQYLVVWFTKLPPLAGSPGKFAAQILTVNVRGTQ